MLKIAVICIGDELLKGSTVNTNLAFIGERLTQEGAPPVFAQEVPDTEAGISGALERALAEADCIITTGGLGPTADDVTKEYIARRLGLRLEEDSGTAIRIRQFWKMRHHAEEIPSRVFNQALVPVGAQVVPNEFGTAPGLILQGPGGRKIILLPGPPGELEPMFESGVLPVLREEIQSAGQVFTKLFRLAGAGETDVEDRTLEILGKRHPLTAAYCAEPGLVRLFLNSPDSFVLNEAAADVQTVFPKELIDPGSSTLAEELIRLLRQEKAVMATAESCTGGLVAKLLTDIPGSSDVFLGGVVSYANEIKTGLLGVDPETLRKYGAVSPQTAVEMVRGLAERFRCDGAVSLTGVAGPGGGTPEKPVGLVYAGIFWRGETEVHELRLRRSRAQIRAWAAASAMNLLRLKILAK